LNSAFVWVARNSVGKRRKIEISKYSAVKIQ